MKRNSILVSAFTIVSVLFLATGLKLQSHIVQPLEGGLSGDPAQTNCAHCHSTFGAPILRNSQFIIKLSPDSAGLAGNSNVVTPSTTYIPGYTQWISLELLGENTNYLSSGGTPRYGFQFTALKASPNDSMAGAFTLVDPKTSMETSVSAYNPAIYGRVSYVGHANADTSTRVWYFKWTAPDSVEGPVTFYYAGNLANGDATFNGDTIFLGSITLNPGHPTGIKNLTGNISSVSVYPVPFCQQLNVNMQLIASGNLSLSLINADGQLVKSLYSGNAAQGSFTKNFDINDVAAGVYFVQAQAGTDTKVIKVLKY